MSRIYVHKAPLLDQMDDDHFALPDLSPENEVGSFRDGEDIQFVAELLTVFTQLRDDEVLVIRKDMY